MFLLSLIHTALAERTDTVSSPSASLTMNDQWTAQFYTATQDATLTRVAVSGYESMAGAATVDVYLWTRVAAGSYTATSLGTLSFVGASWLTYTLELATPRSLVSGQIYGIGFVSNDVAWIPWSTSSRDPVVDTVWGTGLGFSYGAAATSGSRDLASSTRLYAYGGPSFSITVALADLDADGFDVLDDCDDTDAAVYPAAPEVWYDGIDQGCDGRVADDDADGDGHDADFAGGDDCDDTSRSIYPGARDAWYDDVDSDCAGDDDHDQDGDGYPAPSGGGTDCDDLSAHTYPGAVDAWYDGVDGDCAGNDDYDQDRDGYRARTWGGDDCDDVSASVHPGASDRDYDGVDSDCAGDSDYDRDGDGHESAVYGGDDCDDADPARWNDCPPPDTGTTDTGTTDTGTTDTGDTGGGDTGTTDTGGDTGTTDTGVDSGNTDSGTEDTGSTDTGTDEDTGERAGPSPTRSKAGDTSGCATSPGSGSGTLVLTSAALGALFARRRRVAR